MGIVDKMIPGYKDKLWAALPQGVKEYQVKSENDAFEKGIKQHKQWQKIFLAYKETEKGFAPSQKYRKPAVDYTPGNTVDRLENVREPFTDAEWAERKNHRSWDIIKFGYAGIAIFLLYRATNEWPVVWCEEHKEEETQ